MKMKAANYNKTGLVLFSGAVLLASGTTAVRGQATGTFANPAPLNVPAAGTGDPAGAPADPYPSAISVSGLAGTVTKVTVTLIGLTHTFPDDVDILLVGPGGQNAIVMSDVGGTADLTGVTVTLDDAAATSLPDNGPLVSGTFSPTDVDAGGAPDNFPAPAPAPAGGSALSVFCGASPNGTWSLYVVDDLGADIGAITGGWELTISTFSNAFLANIATRGIVQTGDEVLIAGFIVTGTDPKTVVIRGIGPSLTAFGVPNALANPELQLNGPAGFVPQINLNWRDNQAAAIQATGLAPTNDLEAAILVTLPPGSYTAILRGTSNGTGNALVEVYGL